MNTDDFFSNESSLPWSKLTNDRSSLNPSDPVWKIRWHYRICFAATPIGRSVWCSFSVEHRETRCDRPATKWQLHLFSKIDRSMLVFRSNRKCLGGKTCFVAVIQIGSTFGSAHCPSSWLAKQIRFLFVSIIAQTGFYRPMEMVLFSTRS